MNTTAPATEWGESPDAPELSVRASNMVTLYFERSHGRERLLEIWQRYQVPLPIEHFQDLSRFVSLRFVERLTEILVHESGDPNFVYQAGLFTSTPEASGVLYYVVKAIGSPRMGFQKLIELGRTYNRVGRFQIESLERNRTVVTYKSDVVEQNRNFCIGRTAQLAGLPTIWGVAPARHKEHACQVEGAPACRYEFEWEDPDPRWQLTTGVLVGVLAAAILVGLGHPVIGVVVGFSFTLIGRLLDLRAVVQRRNEQLAAQKDGLSDSLRDLERMNAELKNRVAERTAELQHTNERLEVALKQQRALDRLKTEFFDNVSHELRTPLTLILLPVHALLHEGRHPISAEMRVELETLERNAQQLLNLINQLLDLAKLEARKVRLRVEPFNLHALIDNVLRGFLPLAQMRGQTVEVVGPEVEPLAVDVERMESVFQNLFSNALKFTPDDGRITVRIRDAGERVEVDVQDSGPGISEEDLPRIFDRFAQSSAPGTRRFGGTGIGLALVKELMLLHGGKVSVVSAPHQGATFTLTLLKGEAHLPPEVRERRQVLVPVAAERRTTRDTLVGAPRAPLAATPQVMPELAGAPHQPSDDRVLVVEDNAELRASVVRILAPHFRVLSADDGDEGLRIALQEKPSLIVSDVMMPGLSGVDLLKKVRSSPELSDVPVILLTARRALASVLEGFEAGASDYVAKPFAPRELLARVEAQIKLRAAAVRAAENQRLATLGLLTSGFAHEVRNPLNGLLNVLEPLRELAEAAKVEGAGELIDVAVECGDRIRQLTQSLLTFARPGSQFDIVDVRSSLEGALRVMAWQHHESIEVVKKFDDVPELQVDASALDQVWLNLFDNAFRAMPGGGTLRVALEQQAGSVVVAIEDSGCGISPETVSRVFEPFFSTRPAGQGTGLGLAICRRIVLRHGGDLRLSSTVGEGTRVEVHLPVLSPASLKGSLAS